MNMKIFISFVLIGLVLLFPSAVYGSEIKEHIVGDSPIPTTQELNVEASADDSCCIGSHGNVNLSLDGSIDITDLTDLVFYFFYCDFCPPFDCPNAYDVDNSGFVDVTDLTMLVGYLFRGGEAPPPC